MGHVYTNVYTKLSNIPDYFAYLRHATEVEISLLEYETGNMWKLVFEKLNELWILRI